MNKCFKVYTVGNKYSWNYIPEQNYSQYIIRLKIWLGIPYNPYEPSDVYNFKTITNIILDTKRNTILSTFTSYCL